MIFYEFFVDFPARFSYNEGKKDQEDISMITQKDMALIEHQTRKWHDPQTLPISFGMNNKKIKGIPAYFSPKKQTQTRNGITETVYTGLDPETGLEIQTTVTLYDNYPAAEIMTRFTNRGKQNTPLLYDILGYDGVLYGPRPFIYSNSGDFCSEKGYDTLLEECNIQYTHRFTPQGGRACDQQFPYFKLTFGDNTGMCVAIGWPAQWMAHFTVRPEGMYLLSGQEYTNLYLKPGESIRTPRITLVSFDGDVTRGTNVWRRWYTAHIMPKEAIPMMCASHNGGGIEFTEATEKNQIEYLQKAVDSPVPINAWWIDAGWYECDMPDGTRDWTITGSWRVDKNRFPNGLKPVGDFCKENGINLLLWFEPERLKSGTELEKEHPEWLLRVNGYQNIMLNIGIPECCDWLIDMIDSRIKEYGVSIYRQDYNFCPLRYWRENEDHDRSGMNENLYVQAYLRFWDALLERNPGLLIDSCASGGRRNDLETMRRSIPLHPTDFGYGYHTVQQAFARTLSTWIPYYRICGARWENDDNSYIPYHNEDHTVSRKTGKPADYYTRISFLSPFFPFGSELSDPDDASVIQTWKQAAPLMIFGDYYPLSDALKTESGWFVNEYYAPEEGKGFLQAVRNRTCPQDTFCARLQGLDADATYQLDNFRTGQSLQISGKVLMQNGFSITLPPRDAAAWIFTKIQ